MRLSNLRRFVLFLVSRASRLFPFLPFDISVFGILHSALQRKKKRVGKHFIRGFHEPAMPRYWPRLRMLGRETSPVRGVRSIVRWQNSGDRILQIIVTRGCCFSGNFLDGEGLHSRRGWQGWVAFSLLILARLGTRLPSTRPCHLRILFESRQTHSEMLGAWELIWEL